MLVVPRFNLPFPVMSPRILRVAQRRFGYFRSIRRLTSSKQSVCNTFVTAVRDLDQAAM